ncbi:MAG: hypothetical protein WBG26_13935 [Candidatus Binataceae bacterium]
MSHYSNENTFAACFQTANVCDQLKMIRNVDVDGLYALVESAGFALGHSAVDPSRNRGKDFRRAFSFQATHATNVRSFELFGQLTQYLFPIDSAAATAAARRRFHLCASDTHCAAAADQTAQVGFFCLKALEFRLMNLNLPMQIAQ